MDKSESSNAWVDFAKGVANYLGMKKKKKVESPIAKRNKRFNEEMKEIDPEGQEQYTDLDKPATPTPTPVATATPEGARVKKKNKSWLTFVKRR